MCFDIIIVVVEITMRPGRFVDIPSASWIFKSSIPRVLRDTSGNGEGGVDSLSMQRDDARSLAGGQRVGFPVSS